MHLIVISNINYIRHVSLVTEIKMAVEYVCKAVATCTCILWLFIDVIHVHVNNKEGVLINEMMFLSYTIV